MSGRTPHRRALRFFLNGKADILAEEMQKCKKLKTWPHFKNIVDQGHTVLQITHPPEVIPHHPYHQPNPPTQCCRLPTHQKYFPITPITTPIHVLGNTNFSFERQICVLHAANVFFLRLKKTLVFFK